MNRTLFLVAAFVVATGGSSFATTPCPPGFAQLQASDTCVRISGRVRADTLIGSAYDRGSNGAASSAGGRVQMDVRKQTEYGPLRAFIAVGNVRR